MMVFLIGLVGDWKSQFTVAQNELFEKFYKDTLGDLDIPFQFDDQKNSTNNGL